MKYGYDEDGCCIDLLEKDKAERYSIQLYDHRVTRVDISKRNLFEVGSLKLLKKYLLIILRSATAQ